MHIFGEYSVVIIQLVTACMANGMSVEQSASKPYQEGDKQDKGKHTKQYTETAKPNIWQDYWILLRRESASPHEERKPPSTGIAAPCT